MECGLQKCSKHGYVVHTPSGACELCFLQYYGVSMQEQVVDNPFATIDQQIDPQIPTATLEIYNYIQEHDPRSEDTYVNRASAANDCPKRRMFKANGLKGTPLTPRKRVSFLLGELSELVLLYYIKNACVGEGRLYSEVDFGEAQQTVEINGKEVTIYKQKTLTTTFDGLEITCHADGFGKRNFDGKWELIECKSAASYGFTDFKISGPGDYLKQAHTVMASDYAKNLGVDSVRFYYLKKDSGHLYDRLEKFDEAKWESVKNEFLLVDKRKGDVNAIKPPYSLVPEYTGRGGRYKAQFPCTYCPYLEECHGKYTLELKKDYKNKGMFKPMYIFTK